jgi:two-component system copper resistance phosphate regulon response regulator CusR
MPNSELHRGAASSGACAADTLEFDRPVAGPGLLPYRRDRTEAAGAREMKILVVEDEPKTGSYLKQGLSESGFTVDLARDGNDAVHVATTDDYDLVVLDVMLPGRDGWSVLRALRDAGKSMPVLFLTARDRVEDRVKGLELGADDYLIKPFAFSELLARVRTLLRRGKTLEPDVLRIADMELDLYRRRATRGGRRIDLTAKEFALLELFLRRHDEVLPRSLIASQVWDMNFDSDTNVIEVAVRRLRAKVDDGFEPKLIQTVRGMGYVLQTPETD